MWLLLLSKSGKDFLRARNSGLTSKQAVFVCPKPQQDVVRKEKTNLKDTVSVDIQKEVDVEKYESTILE